MREYHTVVHEKDGCRISRQTTGEHREQEFLLMEPDFVKVDMPQKQLLPSSFVQDIAIHGVKEAWLIKNKPLKFLWVFILMGSFCGVTYEIYQIALYYRSNPSATQVKWVTRDMYDYPVMVFCPKTFLNMDKVKKLNMSNDALTYTVSLIQPVFKSMLPPNFQLHKARAEVKSIMQRNKLNTYYDLFTAIATDANFIMLDAITKKPIKMEAYIPSYWLCYRLYLPSVEASTFKTLRPLELLHVPSDDRTKFDVIHNAALILRDTTGTKTNMITFPKNAYYHIDIDVRVHKRLSKPGAKCLSSSEIAYDYYVADCEWACLDYEKYNSGCKKCLPFPLIDRVNSTAEPCPNIELNEDDDDDVLLVNDSETCATEEIIKKSKACLSTCVPVCEQWMYTHSTLTFDSYNSSIHIRLLYNPSNGILTYEEVPTYTFDTFISNIGGQLGLWLGASVVSIFQVFYYICAAMMRREARNISKI